MKKFVCKTILVLFIYFVPSVLYAQTIEQRMVGTWTDHTGGTWVFNSNETFSMPSTGRFEGIRYRVIDSKMFIYYSYIVSSRSETTVVYDIILSTDGRTVILSGGAVGVVLLTRN